MLSQDEFQQQVKDALHHLYDYPYLEDHPLALQYWPEVKPRGPKRAHQLNRLLLESIEGLNPPGTTSSDASRSRYYTLLVYRFVDERPLADIMRELGYSRSQFFREQQRAITLLASVLWQKLPQQSASPRSGSLLAAEVDRLLIQRETVDTGAVVQGVLDVVKHLAQQQGVSLACDFGQAAPSIYGSRTLLRQVLLKALSYLISRPGTCQICVRMRREGQRLITELVTRTSAATYGPNGVAGQPEPGLEPVRQLLEIMGGRWQEVRWGPEESTCSFDLPVDSAQVLLVIDDNEGIIAAFQGYVAAYGLGVVGTRDGAEALTLARQLSPIAITLDIMMPAQDGWEILQRLKDDPTTRPIPVIICSVLEDPQLARSLGAAAYLQKPVSQADLLRVLNGLAGPSQPPRGTRAAPRTPRR